MKRIVTIQDISCVGKCSLTVALPIISAMGVETAVIPTAVLSAHTAFSNFTFRDLTQEIPAVARHWKSQDLSFDAIYTGYLGSIEQLELVSQFFDAFKTPENLIFLDPVMGDHGKLYAGFQPAFAGEMAKLCAKADVIVPNLTEAALLLDIPYPGEDCDQEFLQRILVDLSKLGAKKTILTGVGLTPGKLGVMGYDAETGHFFHYETHRLPSSFHGTGDIFASACVGALMNGLDLGGALALAADFTAESIRYTLADPAPRWYGVNFEEALPMLIRRLGK